MMRNTLGFIAFILTFGFSVSIIGLLFGFPQTNTARHLTRTNSSAYTYKIERLLKRDVHQNGARRNRVARRLRASGFDGSLDSNIEFRKSVLEYVRRSSSMSDSGLPRDFQYAWRNHMKAWKSQASLLQDWDNIDSGQHSLKLQKSSREINRTWDQVLRIAQRYGVRIDGSYYQ